MSTENSAADAASPVDIFESAANRLVGRGRKRNRAHDGVTGSSASVRHEVALSGRARAHSPGSYLLLLPGVTGEGATRPPVAPNTLHGERPVSNGPAR
jgi:hypothetical protein